MVPHSFKPEVEFLEMSIDQYIPRGRNISVKDDQRIQMPTFKDSLTDIETQLLAKYFHPDRENSWRPSLIAFPHFQAFPSTAYNVMHSCRSEMLTWAMQNLNGSSFIQDTKNVLFEDEVFTSQQCDVENIDRHGEMRDVLCEVNASPNMDSQRNAHSGASPSGPLKPKEIYSMTNIKSQNVHSYLFSSDFVSVDPLGKVLILSVPVLPMKEGSHIKYRGDTECINCPIMVSQISAKQPSMQTDGLVELKTNHESCMNNEIAEISKTSNFKMMDMEEIIHDSPILEQSVLNQVPLLVEDGCCDNFNDSRLSPRLTDMIISGVVPESPIHEGGPVSSVYTELVMETPNSKNNEMSRCNEKEMMGSINEQIHTPLLDLNSCGNSRGCVSASHVVGDIQTHSCSKEWYLSSGEKSESNEKVQKFKRLRKHGNSGKRNILESLEEDMPDSTENLEASFAQFTCVKKRIKDKKKPPDTARIFIEEEAEVSSESKVSCDEDMHGNDSCDDSFLDDRINSTASTVDMMAIYRRSMLSQSPIVKNSSYFSNFSSDSIVPNTMNESGSTSGKSNRSLRKPQLECAMSNSISFGINPAQKKPTSKSPNEDGKILDSHRRKLSSFHVVSVSSFNLDQDFLFQLEGGQPDKTQAHCDNMFGDDEFYEGLDLDEVEAQATLLLRSRIEFPIKEQELAPTFDLGI